MTNSLARIFCAPILTFLATAALTLSANYLSAQCQFTVTRSNNNNHCLYAREEVVWSKTGLSASLTASGYNISKTGGTDGWNAGAVSVNYVKNNGWVTTTINETNKYRAFGLSTSDGGVSNTTIQYSFSLRADGQLEIYEGATFIKNLGSYASGKILKIAVESSVVKYYYDNQLKHISSTAPTLPLLVDISLYNTGATIQTVEVANGSDGTFSASAPLADLGTGPSYQWYLNGSPITGQTGTTYSNPALTAADQIYCRLTPGTGGCSVGAVNSNKVNFQIESASRFGNYYVSNTPATQACLNAREEAVVFTKTNVNASGNDLTKNYGLTSGSWDAGAFSSASILNNGMAETTIAETNKTRAFGLSSADGGLNLSSIQFGFFFRADGIVEIYESNSNKFSASYATGQTYKIAVEDGIIKYYRNTTLLYISAGTPTLPLYIDASFMDMDGTLNDIFITNGSTGDFTATASLVGASPSYAWTLNGAPTGSNSSTYSNASLTNGDQVQCTIVPDLTGCSITPTAITLTSRPFGGTFYITNSPSTVACVATEEEIKPADLVGVTTSTNNITKFQGGSGFWNAGATSLNQVLDNGYAKTTVVETNTTRIFGLSTDARATTHSSATNTTIQYGIMLASNSRFYVYEIESDGVTYSFRGDYGSYSAGSVFTIKVDNGTVRYYHGTTNFFTSSVTPTLPLVVDVSFNDLSATLGSIVVSNGCTGVFNAIVANAGASPIYQWKLNGVNVGTNAPSYTDSNLGAGNTVTCTMTPNINGCLTGQLSNLITVATIGGASSPSTSWTGAVSTVWENSANWSNGRPTGYLKVTIPAGMPRYPSLASTAGAYDLTVQSGASVTISGSNQLTIFNQWDNQGTFTANTSKVFLKNCTNNTNTLKVGATGNTFYDLDINNTYDVNLQGAHTISHELGLTDGVISPVAATDLIVIRDNATITGGSTASHVAGKIKKIGDDSFTFPVGKSGVYRPISIAAPSSTTDEFVAEYFKTGQSFGGPSTWPAGLWTISGCEYWNLERTAGSSSVKVTLNWVSADCDETLGPYVGNPATLTVVGFDGTNWKDWGNTAASGTTTGSITSGSSISSYFGPFTLASWTSANVLPIELIDFQQMRTSIGIKLSWATLSESQSDYFQLERAGPDLMFKAIGNPIPAAGTSTERVDYQYNDKKPLNGRNYYRLKQVDLNGAELFSEIIYSDFEPTNNLDVFPNPVNRGEPLLVMGTGKQIQLLDPVTLRVLGNFEAGSFDTQLLRAGVYLLMDENHHYCRLIVK